MQHWRHPQRRLRRPFLLHQGRPPPLHTRQRPWRRPPPRPTAHITEGVWWPAAPARMGAGTDGRTGEGEAQAQHCKTGSSARRDARRRWGGWAAVGASQEARRGLGRTGGGGSGRHPNRPPLLPFLLGPNQAGLGRQRAKPCRRAGKPNQSRAPSFFSTKLQ